MPTRLSSESQRTSAHRRLCVSGVVVVALFLSACNTIRDTGESIGTIASSGYHSVVETVMPGPPVVVLAPIVHVKVIAFNDLHGNLEAPHAAMKIPDPLAPSRDLIVPVGGVAALATLVQRLRSENPNSVVVGAGDMVGASPLISSLYMDEPTIEVLNRTGLEFTSVGNHEFDRGVAELMRKQHGGCARVTNAEPCRAGHDFEGAHFQYLAANVIDRTTHRPILPAYGIKYFDGVPIAFIGVVLKGTKDIVLPAGVAGVTFEDEAESVNALLPELRAQGVKTFIVLIHQGGRTTARLNDSHCGDFEGGILPVLKHLDPSIQVVMSGHTHEAYVCRIGTRLVTSAASYGKLVTDMDLDVERATGNIVTAEAVNRPIASDPYEGVPAQSSFSPLVKDPAIAALVERYAQGASALTQRRVGRITAALPKGTSYLDSESALGDVIADAQLAATRSAGAQIAMTNPGGIRSGLAFENGGLVNYGMLFEVQPFGNDLVTVTMTGDELSEVLEEQWGKRAQPSVLLVSKGFTYTYENHAGFGRHVVAGSIRLDGAPLEGQKRYRVTVNIYLAQGGDVFPGFLAGRDPTPGVLDIDALETYVRLNSPLAPPPLDRIHKKN